ncbi:MAG: GatB/YqeY domain-containing protein [Candidatus Omnitrophica bacterium]|nr:GatB/YqeY domain-containing protein [Candidatus Omnitrophota bacterium]
MLEEKLMTDYKNALKNKNALAVSTLSFLRAQISYAALEKKKDKLEDAESLAVVKKMIKQHQDSIEQFTSGGRPELAEKEKKELDILKAYLPEELSAEAVKKIVEETAASLGASGIKDMGRVMKEVLARTAGSADGKLVSELVRQRLAGPAA